MITVAIATLELKPVPSRIMKKGAKTISGITWDVTINGNMKSINLGLKKHSIIIAKLKIVARINPAIASIRVVFVAIRRLVLFS